MEPHLMGHADDQVRNKTSWKTENTDTKHSNYIPDSNKTLLAYVLWQKV